MPRLVASRELKVVVDHRLFGLVDEAGQDGERPASPRSAGRFVSSNATMLHIGRIALRSKMCTGCGSCRSGGPAAGCLRYLPVGSFSCACFLAPSGG